MQSESENGPTPKTELPLRFDPIPGEDWFFETMREAIDENRGVENDAYDALARDEAERLTKTVDWKGLAKTSPPPQSWFDGDEPKPF